MRLGIHLPQFREPVAGEVLARAAAHAEAAGADDLWVSDHVLLPAGSTRPPESFHEPLTLLTWAAASTRRAGVGTSVLVAPYRHPVLLAKALASLDALSDGRVICGLASGWHEGEFAALGIPFAERGARTDEAIRLMRALWSGEGRFAGRFASIEGARLSPPPARAGGPPIWIGGNSDAALRRAARHGDGWHTNLSEPGRVARLLAALDAHLAARGRDRAEFVVSARVRAWPEELREVAPRLGDLGVQHLLVDLPAFEPERFGERVAEARRQVP